MLKLAGALLTKPEVLQRAAGMAKASPLIKGAAKVASKGGSELLAASLPGAVVTAGLGTLTTGNPLAGAAIGATDLALSFGGARALGGTRFAGKYKNYATPQQVSKALETGEMISPLDLKRVYEPSSVQSGAMLAGSIAAPIVLEPAFLQMQQQQLAASQNVTQAQQLGQQEMLNRMYMPPDTADGTLYQVQGLPQRTEQGENWRDRLNRQINEAAMMQVGMR
jgi:hypothetical protein